MTRQPPNPSPALSPDSAPTPASPPAPRDVPLDAKTLHAAIRVASHDIKNAIGIVFLQLELAVRFTPTDPAQVLELLASIREESRAVVTCVEILNASVAKPVSTVKLASNQPFTQARTPPESPR